MKSKWQLRLQSFASWATEDWVNFILEPSQLFPVRGADEAEMMNFAVVAIEQAWYTINRIFHGKDGISWDTVSDRVNRLA